MHYEAFVRETRERTALCSNAEAIDAARSVLDTLLECLSGPLAGEIAPRLPSALYSRPAGREWTAGERLTAAEFLARVAAREGVCEPDAFCHTQAVLQMLGGVLGYSLLEKVRAELSPEFDAFWGGDPARAHLHQPIIA